MLSRPEPGYIDTYYSRTLAGQDQNYPPLQGERFAEICIIGGGLAGINCAFGLTQRGKSIVLIEANRIGGGASGRNGGFVERGYAASHEEIEKRVGREQANALIGLTRDANQLILDRINAFRIDGGSLNPGMLTVTWRDQPDSIQKYVDDANRNFDAGLEYWPMDRVRDHCKTSRYFQGFYTPHAFQLHSLRYLHGLARVMDGRGGRIFENTKALRIEKDGAGWRVHTEGGTVRAEHVVLCCAMDSHGLNRKIENAAFPVQTYVMTTNPLSDEDLKNSINSPHAIYDVRSSSDYYRILPDNRV
ncbi:MAG TPA: FAD-dependent oxidoreductase, partial [Micavibrio sp.]